ncbi:hypothetical protein X797_011326 [Metarhizium robertsii]|uniref:Uncharacterized protein n=2 Tax=Metarhizium robertsii TaxID=568076 RepID=E9FCH0_METRA|nr:uncharacterized protein MAA_09969 [Metarhizium robertsii ARSEF 23]EFY94598.2 hypothetical protein MAA_09969 [Metarhizium robertsii ARSEF 23]EXU95610.1 hypothetical protein X797_011326 [Metarhizium robertsii]
MASVDITYINPLAIGGLGKPLTENDLAVSRITYNDLPYIENQDRPAENYAKHLLETISLIVRHNMGANFRPHVAHRHDFLPSDKVRFEIPLDGMPYKLTKATDITELDLGNMHSTCFKVIGADIVGVEHAEGPPPLAANKISGAFLKEWTDYLNKHGLTNLLMLDFGQFGKGMEATTEMEVQLGGTCATLVVPLSAVTGYDIEQVPTSWMVPRRHGPEARDSSPDQPAPGTYWAKRVNDLTHKVYINTNASEVGTGEQLVDALVKASILKAT